MNGTESFSQGEGVTLGTTTNMNGVQSFPNATKENWNGFSIKRRRSFTK